MAEPTPELLPDPLDRFTELAIGAERSMINCLMTLDRLQLWVVSAHLAAALDELSRHLGDLSTYDREAVLARSTLGRSS